MEKLEKIEVVILTGLSGAGKTNAIDWFEDRDYYCVDNMPPSLITSFIDLTVSSRRKISKAAFVVDIRGGVFFEDFRDCVEDLKSNKNIDCKILFLDASERTLVKRFNETRRDHPLAGGGPTNRAVIAREKEMLADIRDMSDFIIDTTNMKVSDLKGEIGRLFGGEGNSVFAINVLSFGFKRGLPSEADIVLDMRFIPNPYYVPSLKKLTGKNKKVYNYIFKQSVAVKFVEDLTKLLEDMIPSYTKEGKQHINLAFGCTGGQHRSVAMAERMSRDLKEKGYRVTLEHRDIK